MFQLICKDYVPRIDYTTTWNCLSLIRFFLVFLKYVFIILIAHGRNKSACNMHFPVHQKRKQIKRLLMSLFACSWSMCPRSATCSEHNKLYSFVRIQLYFHFFDNEKMVDNKTISNALRNALCGTIFSYKLLTKTGSKFSFCGQQFYKLDTEIRFLEMSTFVNRGGCAEDNPWLHNTWIITNVYHNDIHWLCNLLINYVCKAFILTEDTK